MIRQLLLNIMAAVIFVLPTVLKFVIITNGDQLNKELFLLQPNNNVSGITSGLLSCSQFAAVTIHVYSKTSRSGHLGISIQHNTVLAYLK